MQALEFLKTIWPSEGLYCLARPLPAGGYGHKVVTTIEEAVHLSQKNPQDCFFTVGTLKEEKVWNPSKVNKQTKELGAFEVRTHANVLFHKAAILDIDCGANKDYISQPEALKALKEFVTTHKLPNPILVNSGRGLHVYFPFTEKIPSDDWVRIGAKLKAVCQHFNLKIDNTATSDKSRVLRVPGTLNCKQSPLPVQVIPTPFQIVPAEEFEGILNRVIAANDIQPPKKTQKIDARLAEMFKGIRTLDYKETDSDIQLIVEKCKQMERVHIVGGPVGYDMRCHALSVAKCCFNADYSVYSSNDPDTDLCESQNEAALTSSITDNPHLCESFANTFPEGCKGCKFKAKIKSPVQLGKVLQDDPIKPIEESLNDLAFRETQAKTTREERDTWRKGVPRFEVPTQYQFSGGVIYKKPSLDDVAPVEICPGIFYPYEATKDDTGDMCLLCYGRGGETATPDIKLSTKLLASPIELSQALAAKGLVLSGPKQAAEMVKYMSEYMKRMLAGMKPVEQHATLGWKFPPSPTPGIHDESDPEKFVLPHWVISHKGIEPSTPSKNLRTVSKEFGRCGTLEEWKMVMNAYNRPGYEGYAFGVLSALGSPLMEFMEYQGAIVSMVGDSAAGKSTVLRAINSFFARPDTFLTQSDTQAAFMAMIGTYGNICITADEITDLTPERVSQLAYAISQGRDKHSMTSDRTVRENEGQWNLLLASTSNRSLLGKLAEYKKDSAPEAYRVFEFQLNTANHKMTKAEADAVFPKLLKNYGHAGDIYIEYVIKNLAEVKQLVADIRREIDEAANASSQERYWTVAIGVNLAGGIIANRLGLLDYDIEAIKKWAVHQIKVMRGNTRENTRGTQGTLAAYLAETIGNTITMGGRGDKAKPFYTVKEPTQRVWNRYEPDNGLMIIDRAQFRKFIHDGAGDWNTVKSELKRDGLLLNDDRLMVLTKGSQVSSSGQCHCIVINTNHETMSGSIIKSVELDQKAA